MSDTVETIWAIMPDYGYEGLREPLMAFRSEETAQRALKLIMKNPSATRMVVCEVPVRKE